MSGLLDLIKREPVAAGAIVIGAVAVAVSFGLQWTTNQVGAITALVGLVVSFIVRGQVTPVATIDAPIIVPPKV